MIYKKDLARQAAIAWWENEAAEWYKVYVMRMAKRGYEGEIERLTRWFMRNYKKSELTLEMLR